MEQILTYILYELIILRLESWMFKKLMLASFAVFMVTPAMAQTKFGASCTVSSRHGSDYSNKPTVRYSATAEGVYDPRAVIGKACAKAMRKCAPKHGHCFKVGSKHWRI